MQYNKSACILNNKIKKGRIFKVNLLRSNGLYKLRFNALYTLL